MQRNVAVKEITILFSSLRGPRGIGSSLLYPSACLLLAGSHLKTALPFGSLYGNSRAVSRILLGVLA
jgi:hypothetical protein